MKFVVEIEEFWIEEEELSASLERQIKDQIVAQMKQTIDKKIDDQITVRVQKVIDEHINAVIQAKLTELVDTGTILSNGKAINIKDHVNNLFTQNIGWNNPRDQVATLAKKFGEELKQRYDAIFANRIVVKLNEQGMLKDEVVKLLIEQK